MAWFFGRPLVQVFSSVCIHIDESNEAKAERERLESEEEAQLRAEAEREIEEEFPNLKQGGK